MKKIIVFCIALTLILSISVPVFANPGSFVVSPSANGAPTLDADKSGDNLKIVAYRERYDELSADDISKFESAYSAIATVNDINDVVESIDDIAETLKVDVNDLAVSDLFYITYENDTDKTGEIEYRVVFKANTLGNYVCLMHYYDGLWHIVADASLNDDGSLEFTADELGPYAIVVSTGDAPEYPAVPSGISTGTVIAIIAAGVVLAAGIFFIIILIKKRKKDDKQEEAK